MKKIKLKYISILIIILIICVTGFIITDNKNAYAENMSDGTLILDSSYSSVSDFFDDTNTYDVDSVSHLSNAPNIRYGVPYAGFEDNIKNGNLVSTDTNITIFTPGLGSGAEAWSNNYHLKNTEKSAVDNEGFELHEGSLPYLIAKRQNAEILKIEIRNKDVEGETSGSSFSFEYGIKIYGVAKIYNESGFTYARLPNSKAFYSNDMENVNWTTPKVIVFDYSKADMDNDKTYYEFNYMMSTIALLYKQTNNVLPKFNLIGHSRGGLTNMRYALDHPDMVNNIISIGTPYFGSEAAEFVLDGAVSDDEKAYDDINNKTKQSQLAARWNGMYNALYSNIRLTTIGITTNFYYGLEAFEEEIFSHYVLEEGNTEKIYQMVKDLHLELSLFSIYYNIFACFGDLAGANNYVANKVSENNADLSKQEVLNYLNNHVAIGDICNGFADFLGDLFVGIDSQLGTGISSSGNMLSYYGANAVNFYLMEADRTPQNKMYKDSLDINTDDHDYVARNTFPITHNTELYIDQVITKVLDELSLVEYSTETSRFMYFAPIFETGSEDLDDYKFMGSVGYENDMHFTVPSTYSGEDVKEIDSGAFRIRSGNNTGEPMNNIYVTLPNTVTKIEPRTFEGMYLLETVNLPSSLTEIGERAFKDCTSLSNYGILGIDENGITTYTLPSNLRTIGNMAFYNTGTVSVNIPARVTSIGAGAFAMCDDLYSINVDDGNTNYSVVNNGLIYTYTINDGEDIIKSLIQVACPVGTSYIVPSTVNKIASYAFAGKTNLTTIDMSSVETVEPLAFWNCTNLDTFFATDLRNIALNALEGTKKFSDSADGSLIVGNVLVAYFGTENTVKLSEILENTACYVNSYAFVTSEVSTLVVDVSNVNIYSNAFLARMPLDHVIFTQIPDEISPYAFGDYDEETNRPFNVYKLPEIIWTNPGFDGITVQNLTTTVAFMTSEDALIYTQPYLYGATFTENEALQLYSEKWIDNYGNVYSYGDVIAVPDVYLTFHPYVENSLSLFIGDSLIWSYTITEDTTFTLTQNTITINNGTPISLNTSVSQYHYFAGWFDNATGTGNAITSFTYYIDGENNVNALYFRENPKEYHLRIYDIDQTLSYYVAQTIYFTVNTFTSPDFDLLTLYMPEFELPVLGYFPNMSFNESQRITTLNYAKFEEIQAQTNDRYYLRVYVRRSDSPWDMGDTGY